LPESEFKKLSNKIAKEYEEKGIPKAEAEEWGRATAARVGRARYGKAAMQRKAAAGRRHHRA
jgi:hypothetical protein